MTSVATIGLDIAKSVFQVHGVDAAGQVVVRQRLARRRVLAFFEKLAPCLVGIEACSSSHYWARELVARGHPGIAFPDQFPHTHDIPNTGGLYQRILRVRRRWGTGRTTKKP